MPKPTTITTYKLLLSVISIEPDAIQYKPIKPTMQAKLAIELDVPAQYVLREDAKVGLVLSITGWRWLRDELYNATRV